MNKYEPFELHLLSIPAATKEVNFTFADIERVLAAPLPESARSHRAWWGNQRDSKNRPQAHAWLSAGFEVDAVTLNKTNGHVKFRRK